MSLSTSLPRAKAPVSGRGNGGLGRYGARFRTSSLPLALRKVLMPAHSKDLASCAISLIHVES
jgi:hypothetical protein